MRACWARRQSKYLLKFPALRSEKKRRTRKTCQKHNEMMQIVVDMLLKEVMKFIQSTNGFHVALW